MIIYPAIDIHEGKCVRLYQGNYDKKKIYYDDPIKAAEEFIEQGAKWLHLIDLDAAKDPKDSQFALIANLINKVDVKIQLGGGVRSSKQIERLLNIGIDRVIIGSIVVTNPEKAKKWLQQFGNEHLVFAMDVCCNPQGLPMVAIQGWQKISDYSVFDLLAEYQDLGLNHIICTDITCDGTLSGPNFSLYRTLRDRFPMLNIQASGGISSLNDLQQLRTAGLNGVILGRSLYEKTFDLSEALAC